MPPRLPIAPGLIVIALDRQQHFHHAVRFEELLLDPIGKREQKIIIVAHPEIIAPIARLPLLEPRRQNFFRHLICPLEIFIDRRDAVGIDETVDVQIEILEQIFELGDRRRLHQRLMIEQRLYTVETALCSDERRTIQVLLAERLDDLELENLQDSIGEVVAAEIGRAVLVAGFDVDRIRHAMIVNDETA